MCCVSSSLLGGVVKCRELIADGDGSVCRSYVSLGSTSPLGKSGLYPLLHQGEVFGVLIKMMPHGGARSFTQLAVGLMSC